MTACDIRLASEDASFSVRETKMAIVADLGSLQRLPSIIGAGHVAELAFTGKDISAARAQQIGLVNEVLPDAGAVVKAAQEMAAEIASNSPLVVQGTKAVIRAADRAAIAEGLDYVAVWNSGFLQSDDLTEALTAFIEKRAAEVHRRLTRPTGQSRRLQGQRRPLLALRSSAACRRSASARASGAIAFTMSSALSRISAMPAGSP